MRHSLLVAISLLFLGCGSGSNSTDDSDTSGNGVQLAIVPDFVLADTATLLSNASNRLNGLSIQEFFAESYQIIKERDIEGGVAAGLVNQFPLGTFHLTDISNAYRGQTTEIKSLILDSLNSYDRAILSEVDQLSYDVYQAHIEFQLEKDQFRNFEYPATYGIFGWPGQTRQFFTELVPIGNKLEANTYLLLLNQLGRRFEQIGGLLDASRVAGIVEPSITLGFSQSQVQSIADSQATATPYYANFVEKITPLTNISDTEKTALTELLLATIEQRVIPAYAALAQKMNGLLSQAPANIGFGQFNGGNDFYAFTLRYFTSSQLTADEIHDLGLQELQRIHAEMRVLFDQLGYPATESIEQLYVRVDSDGGTIQASEAVAFYENIIAEAYTELPNLFDSIPQQEVVVIGDQIGGYYISGSEDGTRPGAFYANNTRDLAYTTQRTLAYHEAVPGHHMQIALAQELALPEFRRRIGFTSFIEGWALYAERLAKDLGWYEGDIYGDLGRLQFEAMRAARLVIDTGIHDRRWTYDQADQFHVTNVGFPGSIARYSVWPGQATAYMTGMLKFLELRERAETQLGPAYDIRSFHSELIGNGSMPTNLLEEVIDRYIQSNLPVIL